MKSISNILTFVKLLLVMMLVAAFTGCANEENLLEPAVPTSAIPALPEDVEAAEVPNFTVSGSFTEFSEAGDCSACTYVVPADMKVVDGKELGIKAGSVVCLQRNIKYQSLEFVNIEGTFDNPVTISYCGE